MYYKDFKGNQISTLGLGVMRLPNADGDPNKIDRVEGVKLFVTPVEVSVTQ